MKSVRVSHNGVSVAYHSADDDEIGAIENCFGYFWTVGRFSNTVEEWSVVSHRVPSIKDISGYNEPSVLAGLFKNASANKLMTDRNPCYIDEIENINCLIYFALENKTTHLYHEHKIHEHGYIRNLVREPIAARYKETGHITMHASACSIDGKGIIMSGLKGAGKSTLLTHLLASGALFIGNDGVLCKEENGSIMLTAVPQCVRLSKETIQNNRALSTYFRNSTHYDFIDDKFEFMPSALDSVFPMHHLSFRSNLELIIIPSLDLSRTDYSIKIVDGNFDLSSLQKSLFYPYHNYTWSPFFAKLNDPAIDISNFADVFRSMPKICYLKYGILDEYRQKKLFDDISNVIRG